MTRDGVAVLCIVVCGTLVASIIWGVKSLGCYTEKIVRAINENGALDRQSRERIRQSNWRTIDEVTAKSDEATLAAERALASFNAVRELIDNHHNHERSA